MKKQLILTKLEVIELLEVGLRQRGWIGKEEDLNSASIQCLEACSDDDALVEVEVV